MRTATRAAVASSPNGVAVTRLREKKGWTREKLAVESEVSYPTIVRVELNNRGDLETIARLARALGVAMEALLR